MDVRRAATLLSTLEPLLHIGVPVPAAGQARHLTCCMKRRELWLDERDDAVRHVFVRRASTTGRSEASRNEVPSTETLDGIAMTEPGDFAPGFIKTQ